MSKTQHRKIDVDNDSLEQKEIAELCPGNCIRRQEIE
jgi:hypothetical protein